MVYIPFIYFLILLISNVKKRGYDVGAAIVTVYLIVSFFGIILDHDLPEYSVSFTASHFLATIFYCTLLTISIWPFYELRSRSIKEIVLKPDKERALKIIGWFFIVFSFFNILLSISDILSVFASGNFGEIRQDYYSDVLDEQVTTNTKQSWYMYFVNLVPHFSPIVIGLFFYSVVYQNNSKWYNGLLFISSLSLFATSILTAARTQLIYWVLTVFVMFVFFKPQMQKKTIRKMIPLFFVLGFLTLDYVIIVATSRFDVNRNNSLLFYSGQQFSKFCELWDKFSFSQITLDRVFPLTSKYIFRNNFDYTQYRIIEGNRIGMHLGVFYTFLGDAMVDFGRLGMIIYTIVIAFISKKIVHRRNEALFSFSKFLLFIIFVRIPLLGVFAYVYYGFHTSFMILVTVLIAYYLNYEKKDI